MCGDKEGADTGFCNLEKEYRYFLKPRASAKTNGFCKALIEFWIPATTTKNRKKGGGVGSAQAPQSGRASTLVDISISPQT